MKLGGRELAAIGAAAAGLAAVVLYSLGGSDEPSSAPAGPQDDEERTGDDGAAASPRKANGGGATSPSTPSSSGKGSPSRSQQAGKAGKTPKGVVKPSKDNVWVPAGSSAASAPPSGAATGTAKAKARGKGNQRTMNKTDYAFMDSILSEGPLADHECFRHALLGYQGRNVRAVQKATDTHIVVSPVDYGRWKVDIGADSEEALAAGKQAVIGVMHSLVVEVMDHSFFLWHGIQPKIEAISNATSAWTQLGYRVVCVGGTTDQVKAALDALYDLIGKAILLSLPYKADKSGLLIGSQGANIKMVRDELDVYLTVEPDTAMLHMLGFHHNNINAAVDLLERTVRSTIRRMVQTSVICPLGSLDAAGIEAITDAYPLTIRNETDESFDIVASTQHIIDRASVEFRNLALADPGTFALTVYDDEPVLSERARRAKNNREAGQKKKASSGGDGNGNGRRRSSRKASEQRS